MARGRFQPGKPLSVADLNAMNRAADSGQPRILGSSVDIAGGESGMAVQTTKTLDGNLRYLKVTGTVTGGYSFQEVYNPLGDGTYVTMPHGVVSVGSSVKLVPPSGITFATNDIVVARLNPFNANIWEAIAKIYVPGTPSLYNTSLSLTSDFSITGTSGTYSTVLSRTLANAGTYLVGYDVMADYGANTLDDYLLAKLDLSGTVVKGTLSLFCHITVTGTVHRGSTSATAIVTATASQSLNLQCCRLYLGSAPTATIVNRSQEATYLWATQIG